MPRKVKLPPPAVASSGTTGTAPALAPGRASGTTGTAPALVPGRASGTTGTTPALVPGRASGTTGTSPALPADQFGAVGKLVVQLTGRDAIRAPGQLTSDLGKLVDPEQLPGRLSADLALHLPELVSLLSLTRQQKASRLVEFLVPYAAKLAELSPALSQGRRTQLEQKLLAPITGAGLDQVVEVGTGKSGVEVARELLSAPTPEEARAFTRAMTFDAPTWAARPETAAASEVKRGEPSLIAQAQPLIAPPRDQRPGGLGTVEEESAKKDRGDKRLGKNMVWNVLHIFRGDAEDPVDLRKQKELMLATGGIIVMVITVALVIVLALVLGK